jgi:WD40 repeat protein
MKTRVLAVWSVVLVALGAAPAARAQYFGRAPVQWERFEFEVLKTRNFDVYHYPEGKQAAELAARMAERWYARLSKILGFHFRDRQALILYASHPHFEQTKTVGGPPGETTGGVTEAFKRRIVLPLGGSLAETDHVLGHELVHAFQFAMTGQGRISSSNYPSALRMPLWFIEGMAEYLSVGPVDAHTAMWMRDAARKEKLPAIKDLSNPKYFPYRYGQALWAYLAGRFGDQLLGDALRAIGPRTNDAEAVLKEVLGVGHEQLTEDWHAAIRGANAPVLVGKQDPGRYGPALVTDKAGGELNVGPALSPDGSRLAFLSERELFSVELFLADAGSGDIIRRLSRTATDPHLQSIQFINSAGAWDRSGKRLALGAVAKGRPLLVILDAESGRRTQEVPFDDLGEIYTPSFSPDGRRVVFSALVNGFTDLFVYDLEQESRQRLTDDPFADLQPAWSPDGRSIAFVTDRYSTRLATLDQGNYRLAAIDVASGEVRALPSFEQGKNINPQWAPSSQSLYFVSDTSGISNLYRLDLAKDELRQLTDLSTGVSGITALSPTLSAAAGVDRLAYTVYENERYNIYTIRDAERLEGWPAKVDTAYDARLIPGGRPAGDVVVALENATAGLANPEAFQQEPYKAKLGLDYIGQPYVAAGVDRYGAAFAGGIAMSFSDMLGEHTLDTIVQASSVQGFTDVGGLVRYVNRSRRFNWGAQVAQIPYTVGGFASGVAVVDGQPLFQEQTLIQRQLDRRVSLLGLYPLDSATRIEVEAGFRSLSFKNRLTTDSFSLVTGQFLGTRREDLPGPDTINLGEGAAALVRDTSVFGATSPILGQRFRLEASPVFGSLNYTGLLGDFRQYVQPFRPLTLAGRVLHFGRYGSGGEDPRLVPLFVGRQSLVRGYESGSFSVSECGEGGGCPVFDQLLGSRVLAMNFEARFPLLALFGAKRLYGPIPVEVGGFFDAGVAWDSTVTPKIFGGERDLVRSVGATARVNLFGFAVLQVDYAKPLDRPGRKPFFQFNLLNGF